VLLRIIFASELITVISIIFPSCFSIIAWSFNVFIRDALFVFVRTVSRSNLKSHEKDFFSVVLFSCGILLICLFSVFSVSGSFFISVSSAFLCSVLLVDCILGS
jgi:hypothetical protein